MLSNFEVQQLQYNYTSRLNLKNRHLHLDMYNIIFAYISSWKRRFSSMIFLSTTILREAQLIQLKSNSHIVLVRVGQFFSWLELLLDSLSLHS